MPALFLETIRIEDGEPQNLKRHLDRMQKTARDNHFVPPAFSIWSELLRSAPRVGTIKCRLIYREKVESISFDPYTPRLIQSLALVRLPKGFDYSYKYLRRHALDDLRLSSGADEILLVNEEGVLTDSSFSNLLFQAEEKVWLTPSMPLLEGTMRATLLEKGTLITGERVLPATIKVKDLMQMKKIALVNAMLPLERAIFCPPEMIQNLKSF